MADLAETSTGSCLPSMRQGSQRTASPIEEIAKLAAKAKFDAFFVGSVFRKVTYPIGHRHFAKNPNPTKKARIWARRSFAIPSDKKRRRHKSIFIIHIVLSFPSFFLLIASKDFAGALSRYFDGVTKKGFSVMTVIGSFGLSYYSCISYHTFNSRG